MTNPPHKKISYTAIICARSLAEHTKIPYARELYQVLKNNKLAKSNYHNMAFFLSRYIKGIQLFHNFLEARYLSVNETLKQLKNPPVLELAAGLSARGLSYPNFYIETDLPGMIKIKTKLLRELPKNPNHLLKPLNLLDKKQLFEIGKIYKKICQKKPIAIIHTGLWTYLSKDEQKQARDNIRDFLKKYSPKGYWITPDFRPKSFQKNLFFKFFRSKITKKTGRPSTRFESDREVESFMKEAGLKLKIVSNNHILSKLNTKKKFKTDIKNIKKQTSDMKIYIARLK